MVITTLFQRQCYVKAVKASGKQLKLFAYLRIIINNDGFIFLQRTHFSSKDDQKWEDNVKGPLFFSQGKSNSCGVGIGYHTTEAFKVVNTACNKNGRILIFDA